MSILPSNLLFLPEIFRRIKTGHHWCFGDAEYAELSERFDDYKAFFQLIDLTLHRDPRGFIYATIDEGDFKGSDTITKFVVFTAIWVDAVSDAGGDIAVDLFVPHQRIGDLPHLVAESHRRMLGQLGVVSLDDLRDVLRGMERLGLVEFDSQGLFSLRPAFNRLLDVCLESGRAASIDAATAESSNGERENA
jgi:hypothetical protein